MPEGGSIKFKLASFFTHSVGSRNSNYLCGFRSKKKSKLDLDASETYVERFVVSHNLYLDQILCHKLYSKQNKNTLSDLFIKNQFLI